MIHLPVEIYGDTTVVWSKSEWPKSANIVRRLRDNAIASQVTTPEANSILFFLGLVL